MAIEKVKEYLKQKGFENRIQEFEVSSATVELAALALNTKPEHIAKTISFYVNNLPIVVVCAGDCKVNGGKFKQEFKTKPTMIAYDEVEKEIGHAVGGVCPFALNDNVEVYLDVSLKRFEKVYPACGSSNSAIGLSIAELEKLSNYKKWIDVCKLINENC